jgi:hypothetical protein
LYLERRKIYLNQTKRLSNLNRVIKSNRIKFKSLFNIWGRQCIFCYIINELDIDYISSYYKKYKELEV